MAKKYQHYQIIVEHANGEKEDIEMLKSTDIDKSNWKQMRKVYNDVKEQYKDKNVSISFCGSSDDGTLDIMFTKEFKGNEDIDNKKSEPEIVEIKTLEQCVLELTTLTKDIDKRMKCLDTKLATTSKQQDFLIHQIELSEDDISDNDIKKIFNDIKQIRIARRKIKSEKNDVSNNKR